MYDCSQVAVVVSQPRDTEDCGCPLGLLEAEFGLLGGKLQATPSTNAYKRLTQKHNSYCCTWEDLQSSTPDFALTCRLRRGPSTDGSGHFKGPAVGFPKPSTFRTSSAKEGKAFRVDVQDWGESTLASAHRTKWGSAQIFVCALNLGPGCAANDLLFSFSGFRVWSGVWWGEVSRTVIKRLA